MQKQRGIETTGGVLDSTVPVDVGTLSQRRRIVEAMIDSCAAKTYAGTTIADIVSRASISRTTFYKHFAGKRECFEAAIERTIEELSAVAAAAHSPADSPPEAVRKAVAAALELMAAKPAMAQLVMVEAIAVEPNVARRYRRIVTPALESLWGAAGQSRRPHTDPRLSFGRAQVLIYNQIVAGETQQLLALLPDVVYLALLPLAGHDEALRQARLAGPGGFSEPR